MDAWLRFFTLSSVFIEASCQMRMRRMCLSVWLWGARWATALHAALSHVAVGLMKRCRLLRCAPRQTETFTGSSELLSISVLAPDAARGSHWQLWDAGAGESRAGSLGGGRKPHIYITNHHQTMRLTTGQIGCSVRSGTEWLEGGSHPVSMDCSL